MESMITLAKREESGICADSLFNRCLFPAGAVGSSTWEYLGVEGLLSWCEDDDALGPYIAGKVDCPKTVWSVDYLQGGDGNDGQRSHKELVAGGVLILRMDIQ